MLHTIARKWESLLTLLILVLSASPGSAQTSQFTYQGKLTDAGNPANANYDFEIKLFDALSGGAQQGSTIQRLNVAVANGIFTVQLDFTAAFFTGADRFLEISVRAAGVGSFTVLSPRQQINSTPYAIKSTGAASADNLSVACVNCVTDSQINGLSGTKISGTIPLASVPDLGASYIKNTTSPQASSNFNISGSGTAAGTLSANIINATTQYNIFGGRVLSIAGIGNLFVGINAGASNPGSSNAFFGSSAGRASTTGSNNAFFGLEAGFNTTASNNSFFGFDAGFANTSGTSNSFFGGSAGNLTTMGGNNSFFGASAGNTNTIGANNTAIGNNADMGANNLDHATAIGADSTVSTSNTVVLGRASDTVQVPGNFNTTGGTLSGNTVNAATQYNIGGSRVLSNGGLNNLFAGAGAGAANPTGGSNSFFGAAAGFFNTSGGQNSFFGTSAGFHNTTGCCNSFFGTEAGFANQTGSSNSFFGVGVGLDNTTGSSNSFFGANAGQSNTTEHDNTFIGNSAGLNNGAVDPTNAASLNTFVGTFAGFSNNTGSINTVIGASADVGANNLTNAAAIGSFALVTASNSLVLGSINGTNGATASTSVGIGTTAPAAKLDIGVSSAHLLLGDTGCGGGGAAGIGFGSSLTGCADYSMRGDGTNTLINRPTGGFISFRENNSTQMFIAAGGNVGLGTTAPTTFKLQVAGSVGPNSDNASSLGDASHHWTAVFATNGTIQTSDARLKHHIGDLTYGLSEVLRLRPVSFAWKDQLDGKLNIGLIAQEVEPLIPEVIFRQANPTSPLGMNYTGLLPVVIKAIQEQQTQIEQQRAQLKSQKAAIQHQQGQIQQQQVAISGLKKLVCLDHPNADLCK